jgi:hypothetical protein
VRRALEGDVQIPTRVECEPARCSIRVSIKGSGAIAGEAVDRVISAIRNEEIPLRIEGQASAGSVLSVSPATWPAWR